VRGRKVSIAFLQVFPLLMREVSVSISRMDSLSAEDSGKQEISMENPLI